MVAPAAADPQFVTLERVDREDRLGVQASLQFYEDTDGAMGLRTEVYGQFSGSLRGGGTIGGFAKLPLGFLFLDDQEDFQGVGDVEIGGFYVTRWSSRTDFIFRLGLTLPTGSDELSAAGITGVERNIDLINMSPDTLALKPGIALRTPLGVSAFLQADFAIDLGLDQPGDNDVLFHANVGLGAFVGSSLALMGEFATTFGEEGFLGSIALGIRFRGAAHPHIAYEYVFSADDYNVTAHVISFGFYASL